jgi:hypothetical protein
MCDLRVEQRLTVFQSVFYASILFAKKRSKQSSRFL